MQLTQHPNSSANWLTLINKTTAVGRLDKRQQTLSKQLQTDVTFYTIDKSICLCLLGLNFDQVFTVNTSVFGQLRLFRYVLWYKMNLVPNDMHYLPPMLAGSREQSLAH